MDSTETGGSSYIVHVGHAAEAIAAGKCKVALITLAGRPRHARGWRPGAAAAQAAAAAGGRRRHQRGARSRLREHLRRLDPQHLRHVRHAPHVRVRHHLRAAGLDQGRRLAPRPVERARHAARGGDGRGGAGLADDRRPAAPAGLLRDHRRRRRGDRGRAGGRQEPEPAAGQGHRPRRGAQGPARRQGPRPHLFRRRLVRPARPSRRRASRPPTSSTPRSTTASPSPC